MFNQVNNFFHTFYKKNPTSKEIIIFLNFIKKNLNEFKITKHPLGFIYIELAKEDSAIYRLHIWAKDVRYTQEPNWPIHNHIYDIESYLIIGKIKQTTYNLVNAKENPSYPLYKIKYTKKGTIKEKLKESTDLEISDIKILNTGESYSFPKESFHRIDVPNDSLTATLVKSSAINNNNSPIVVATEENKQKNLIYNKDILNNDLIIQLLTTIIETLKEKKGGGQSPP